MKFELTEAEFLKLTLERQQAYLKKQKKHKYKSNKQLREEKMAKLNYTQKEFLKTVKNHIKEMKKQGRCVQCQYPWYDGLCECGQNNITNAELDRIVALVSELEKCGVNVNKI